VEGREVMAREIRRMDVVFVAVSIVIWVALVVWGIYLAMVIGVAGAGMAFIVYIVAIIGWVKLAQQWIRERNRVLEELREGNLGEEIKRLREAIEELRRSLEG